MILFHRFLIGTAIIFCAGLGVWMFVSYRGNAGLMILAAAFVVAAGGLTYYLKHLNRFLHRNGDPAEPQ